MFTKLTEIEKSRLRLLCVNPKATEIAEINGKPIAITDTILDAITSQTDMPTVGTIYAFNIARRGKDERPQKGKFFTRYKHDEIASVNYRIAPAYPNEHYMEVIKINDEKEMDPELFKNIMMFAEVSSALQMLKGVKVVVREDNTIRTLRKLGYEVDLDKLGKTGSAVAVPLVKKSPVIHKFSGKFEDFTNQMENLK